MNEFAHLIRKAIADLGVAETNATRPEYAAPALNAARGHINQALDIAKRQSTQNTTRGENDANHHPQ